MWYYESMCISARGHRRPNDQRGFTVVELLIVIVVIGILATLTIIAYAGVQGQARSAKAKDSTTQAAAKIKEYAIRNSTLPASLSAAGVENTTTVAYTYTNFGNTYCVAAATGGTTYQSLGGDSPMYGDCLNLSVTVYDSPLDFNFTYTTKTPNSEGTITRNSAPSWGGGSIFTNGPANGFIAEVQAFINPPITDTYTFDISTDDRGLLYIDNQLVVDGTGVTSASGSINLTAGQRVPLRFVFKENGGNAYYTLRWAYTGVTATAIPASAYNQ